MTQKRSHMYTMHIFPVAMFTSSLVKRARDTEALLLAVRAKRGGGVLPDPLPPLFTATETAQLSPKETHACLNERKLALHTQLLAVCRMRLVV